MIPKACTTSQIMTDPEIELVLNLTTPESHYDIAKQAIAAGKSVYNEKPLAIELEEGQDLVVTARKQGVLLGGAPDTFLGGGIQTCRQLIDEGLIGVPVAAVAFMTCRGHERWHPSPEFYYQWGGGPMFAMGPYYLTALITLLGAIHRVTATTRITFPERTITSQPKYGAKIPVEVPTHVTGLINFTNNAIGTIITSFDVWETHLPKIEIYGTQGSLSVPDPNTFGGPVQLYQPEHQTWRDIPLSHGYTDNSRGLGVADMATALRSGQPHRANGDLTYHVLEAMHAFHTAADQERTIHLDSHITRPAPLPSTMRT
jgi:predicted dehydrogenase